MSPVNASNTSLSVNGMRAIFQLIIFSWVPNCAIWNVACYVHLFGNVYYAYLQSVRSRLIHKMLHWIHFEFYRTCGTEDRWILWWFAVRHMVQMSIVNYAEYNYHRNSQSFSWYLMKWCRYFHLNVSQSRCRTPDTDHQFYTHFRPHARVPWNNNQRKLTNQLYLPQIFYQISGIYYSRHSQ